ncbi:hypothetical protein NDR87_26585 [Nocardia sp. CDC159]|uniref:Uncharacterized protein n=1 Tax=Nocardia pulmonis TaxID=2951408 RepID=A0A9X2ECV6_9NOCA|nr:MULTISPECIES: hypothetical protein [Nocardia]MCM6777060.1 hypothetical protein [Nocardia pulmonis]MCM6789945.1 hypothetical protein [Nocardia sp. CDC159]
MSTRHYSDSTRYIENPTARHRKEIKRNRRGLYAAAAFASLSTVMMTGARAGADIPGLPVPIPVGADPVGDALAGAQAQLPQVGAALDSVAPPGVDVQGMAQGALDAAVPDQASPVRGTLQSLADSLHPGSAPEPWQGGFVQSAAAPIAGAPAPAANPVGDLAAVAAQIGGSRMDLGRLADWADRTFPSGPLRGPVDDLLSFVSAATEQAGSRRRENPSPIDDLIEQARIAFGFPKDGDNPAAALQDLVRGLATPTAASGDPLHAFTDQVHRLVDHRLPGLEPVAAAVLGFAAPALAGFAPLLGYVTPVLGLLDDPSRLTPLLHGIRGLLSGNNLISHDVFLIIGGFGFFGVGIGIVPLLFAGALAIGAIGLLALPVLILGAILATPFILGALLLGGLVLGVIGLPLLLGGLALGALALCPLCWGLLLLGPPVLAFLALCPLTWPVVAVAGLALGALFVVKLIEAGVALAALAAGAALLAPLVLGALLIGGLVLAALALPVLIIGGLVLGALLLGALVVGGLVLGALALLALPVLLVLGALALVALPVLLVLGGLALAAVGLPLMAFGAAVLAAFLLCPLTWLVAALAVPTLIIGALLLLCPLTWPLFAVGAVIVGAVLLFKLAVIAVGAGALAIGALLVGGAVLAGLAALAAVVLPVLAVLGGLGLIALGAVLTVGGLGWILLCPLNWFLVGAAGIGALLALCPLTWPLLAVGAVALLPLVALATAMNLGKLLVVGAGLGLIALGIALAAAPFVLAALLIALPVLVIGGLALAALALPVLVIGGLVLAALALPVLVVGGLVLGALTLGALALGAKLLFDGLLIALGAAAVTGFVLGLLTGLVLGALLGFGLGFLAGALTTAVVGGLLALEAVKLTALAAFTAGVLTGAGATALAVAVAAAIALEEALRNSRQFRSYLISIARAVLDFFGPRAGEGSGVAPNGSQFLDDLPADDADLDQVIASLTKLLAPQPKPSVAPVAPAVHATVPFVGTAAADASIQPCDSRRVLQVCVAVGAPDRDERSHAW